MGAAGVPCVPGLRWPRDWPFWGEPVGCCTDPGWGRGRGRGGPRRPLARGWGVAGGIAHGRVCRSPRGRAGRRVPTSFRRVAFWGLMRGGWGEGMRVSTRGRPAPSVLRPRFPIMCLTETRLCAPWGRPAAGFHFPPGRLPASRPNSVRCLGPGRPAPAQEPARQGRSRAQERAGVPRDRGRTRAGAGAHAGSAPRVPGAVSLSGPRSGGGTARAGALGGGPRAQPAGGARAGPRVGSPSWSAAPGGGGGNCSPAGRWEGASEPRTGDPPSGEGAPSVRPDTPSACAGARGRPDPLSGPRLRPAPGEERSASGRAPLPPTPLPFPGALSPLVVRTWATSHRWGHTAWAQRLSLSPTSLASWWLGRTPGEWGPWQV